MSYTSHAPHVLTKIYCQGCHVPQCATVCHRLASPHRISGWCLSAHAGVQYASATNAVLMASTHSECECVSVFAVAAVPLQHHHHGISAVARSLKCNLHPPHSAPCRHVEKGLLLQISQHVHSKAWTNRPAARLPNLWQTCVSCCACTMHSLQQLPQIFCLCSSSTMLHCAQVLLRKPATTVLKDWHCVCSRTSLGWLLPGSCTAQRSTA